MRMDLDQPQDSELKELLEENLRYARDTYRTTERIKRYIFWGQVFSLLKVIIVVVPLVLGFLYIQPYLRQVLTVYGSLFGLSAVPVNPTGQDNQPSAADLLKQCQQLRQAGKIDDLKNLLK